jgi:hypothetical protein
MAPYYIAQLTNLDDPDFLYYDLLAELPAAAIIPPVQLPETMLDRLELDEEFNAMMIEMMGEG